jgi:hypothetical protein
MTGARGSSAHGDRDVRYSDDCAVGQNAFEFMCDFGQLDFHDEHARMHTRIVMSPAHAKELSRLLNAAIRRYEQTYGAIGEISTPDDDGD